MLEFSKLRQFCTIIGALLISACSGTDDEGAFMTGGGEDTDEIVMVDFDMTAYENSFSRSDFDDDHIHSWVVLIIDQQGKLQGCHTWVEPDDTSDPNNMGTYTHDVPDEYDIDKMVGPYSEPYGFTQPLHVGNYRILAFANVDGIEQIGRCTKLDLSYTKAADGETATEFDNGEHNVFTTNSGTNVNDLTWTGEIPTALPVGSLLPMSGLQNIRVSSRPLQAFHVYVVPMMAKIELQLTNETRKAINLKELLISKIYSKDCPMRLFRRPELFETQPIWVPDNLDTQSEAIDITKYYMVDGEVAPVVIPAHDENAAEQDNKRTVTLYVHESDAANYGGGLFAINATMTRGNLTTEENLSGTVSDITDFNRCEHITLPITFINWVVELSAYFYAPIGGNASPIPATQDEKMFYFSFHTSGKFAISTRVRLADMFGQDDSFLDPEGYEVLLELNSDENDIFNVKPYYNEETGEIVGEIRSGKLGKAEFSLQIRIFADRQQGKFRHILERTFVIARENR